MKKFISFAAVVMCLLTVFGGLTVYGAAYKTYTYSIYGLPVDSPDAYTPDRQVDAGSMGLGVSSIPNLEEPTDMVVDDEMNVYIVERKQNRIIKMDRNYRFVQEFGASFINDQGVPDSLSSPTGMFVADDAIYVADTDNARIVVFNRDGTFKRIVLEPQSQLMGSDAIYKPVAVAVDSDGNIYVVSSTTYMGIIVMNSKGEFKGFLGAQKSNVDLLAIFWRQFQTAEQIARSTKIIPTEFNNITIDDEGFVYVTTSSISKASQQESIKNNTADYSPVKKLNSSGNDVMMRSGFFGPGGEVFVNEKAVDENSIVGASSIVDVAIGPEGTWSIIDEKRSKVYTYDQYGRLLFIFGDMGQMLGNLVKVKAICYQGTKILVLDSSALNITVYEQTQYGEILIKALKNNNDRNYDMAVDDWQSILQRNGNFDTAYVGIGKAYYRDGRWDDAMEQFKYAYDTTDYSEAFHMYRKEWVSNHVWAVPLVVVAFLFLLVRLFKWAGKVNREATHMNGKKRTFKQEVLYAFHLFSHPFDGFWDLKHEKRGSVRGAVFWLVMAVLTFTYQSIGQSYLFNPTGTTSSVFVQAISILMPVFLWVTSNWCLTTLFDGEGSFKDIFIASCYSLTPLPLLIIPSVLLTHIFTLNEVGIVSLLVTLAWVWVGILVFSGMMITHGYSLFKNLITCLATIIGAAFIMFIALLFTGLLQKIVGFVSSIVTELSYRS